MFGLAWFGKKNDTFIAEAYEHVDKLYGAAMRMTRDPDDAQDLIQDTFLNAYRSRKTFQRGTNMKAWLFRILVNTYITQYKKKQTERRWLSRDVDFSEIEGHHMDEWMASDMLRHELPFSMGMSEEVKRALEGLPDDYRMVVELADIQELSYTEIAQAIERPIGTVMSRLHRGRKLLQKQLRDYAVEEGIIKADGGTDGKSGKASTTKSKQDSTLVSMKRVREA